MKWPDIVRPETANIILGKRGSGKSGLAYWLQEECASHYGLRKAVCNFPSEKAGRLLPHDVSVIDLSQIGDVDDSVVIIDEGTTQIPAGQRALEEFIKGCQALCRQRNQILIIIFHASNDVGTRILRGMDTLIFKYPSLRQIQWGAKDQSTRWMLEEARSKIHAKRMAGLEWRRFSLVDSEEPEFHGLLQNGLPSYWTDELSKAWASAKLVCPKCGKPMSNPVSGVCQQCYASKLTTAELEKAERKAAKSLLRKGEAPISALKEVYVERGTDD